MENSFKLISLIILFIIYGCENEKYAINENSIKGLSKNDNLTIAELTGDKFSSEKLRVCLNTSSDNNKTRSILYFNRKNDGYHWSFCTLDLRFVENDSLKKLKLGEKFHVVEKENHENLSLKYYDTIPLDFKPHTWYHFFGLNVQGSFFVYVDKDGIFHVEYFGGGPF
ncbi:MAG: hypothetical protein EOO46_21755 [Flavobacterium sp.]|nr:MAG: hypothetical protein EOO46_21755 [Flavobacterium sp.]